MPLCERNKKGRDFPMNKIKVLVIDDSSLIRKLLTEIINAEVDMEVVGTAPDPIVARDLIKVKNPDVLTLDVEMPRMDGLDFLEKLMRRVWMFWQPRVGAPYSNMQFGFRGHAITLCNYRTASDGEAFAEGFRRLGLGKVLGTRTWGGEIWLSSNNFLVDKGIATAAENGVYGLDGNWLIEGHGVDPDVVVDNLPRATFNGDDAQLKAAVEELLRAIDKDPRPVPKAPPYPDKSK